MSQLTQTAILGAVMRACEYLNPDSKGGAHADVLCMNADRLAVELCSLSGVRQDEQLGAALTEMAGKLANRFIVKRGKIEDFTMQLVGDRANTIPRAAVSHAFGPYGYNLLPTVEKALVDASEAAREVPYFAYGDRDSCLAPDILGLLSQTLRSGKPTDGFLEHGSDAFLSFLDEFGDENTSLSIYSILTRDAYFKGKAESFDDISGFQRFLRKNPFNREMEENLSEFFQAPITVGLRDTVRWALGSRHPEIGWERARRTIMASFDAFGTEHFLPPEVTYYALDLDATGRKLATLFEVNERVLDLFSAQLDEHFKRHGFFSLPPPLVRRISRQVLEFHHGYPIYELEPYQGLLSVSTLKMAVRVLADFALMTARLSVPEKRNTNLSRLEKRPGDLVSLLASLDDRDRKKLLEALHEALTAYVARGGVRDQHANVWSYHRVARTFYSFQEKAYFPAGRKGTDQETFTLEQLHGPAYNHLLRSLPELASKLTVFFTLVYRYYKDTGFVPDLRPSNAGRDIFLLGIWGYVSENLLITTYRDEAGELHADLSFVDNKDQFKEYRRSEDRVSPVGLAKHALRLTGSLVEPAMLRSIGLFTEITEQNRGGVTNRPLESVDRYAAKGLDIVQAVIHFGVQQLFDTGKAAAQDAVDDVFTGVKKWLRLG